jgi:hypothetical protein
VFDHDVVSKDDLMGEAEIDLPTMINAATPFGDPELLGDIQICRWLRSNNNALVKDSAVVVAGGKVKQGVTLKLQPHEAVEVETTQRGFDAQRKTGGGGRSTRMTSQQAERVAELHLVRAEVAHRGCG